ncbi:hypothetical protein [Massilia glaciei]|uniref:Uncharacterized protein n=1 Tax=Massilia glaciei TaxID=1524097 RepID=A0A2U2I7R1_9BURK|nr:hypothetical protein [Massilia glaciei]PWF55729.1 hypothetical protein C7C56_000315 [Massilia glaciei]
MENLPAFDLLTTPFGELKKLTLVQILTVPFAPLMLLRPLKLFKSTLGLTPGVATVPDPEFLVVLLEGMTHQEALRGQLNIQFKNLENLLRGAHVPTNTTLRLLQAALGIDADVLAALVHGNKNGHLMPQYVNGAQVMEGLFFNVFKVLGSAVHSCPSCQGNVLADMDAWWGSSPLRLAPDAYGFVDRLLKCVVGADWLLGYAKPEARPLKGSLVILADPRNHPIGQWMDLVRFMRGDKHLWQIAIDDGIGQAGEVGVPAGRLAKWKSGQDLLPMAKASLMIKDLPKQAALHSSLLAARMFALAIDVVRATAAGEGYPTRAAAQQIVADRFKQLQANFKLSIEIFSGMAQSQPAVVAANGSKLALPPGSSSAKEL